MLLVEHAVRQICHGRRNKQLRPGYGLQGSKSLIVGGINFAQLLIQCLDGNDYCKAHIADGYMAEQAI